ncbi:MAG TPA: glutathione S-transferase family protein [Quisquiliibacterium sp.]|nr:glutathione S-transferase family protein [Quisquiliibacterium sp.]
MSPVPILHHYDFSPFSEKIRLAFGFKGLDWHAVEAPSVMPKPDLVALTGGYRHIPVMQIGADVFCDTRTIARALDRLWPARPLVRPATRGLATALEAWAERDLFWPIARYVTGVNADTIDPQLHVDRAALRGKPAPSPERLRAVARRSLAQVRAELPVVDRLLAHGGAWLLPDGPGQADFAVYHGLWFLGAFAVDCSDVLAPYPAVRSWMARVAAIGHGRRMPMSAAEALAAAARGAPAPLPPAHDDDSLPPVGSRVSVRPDDYTTEAVTGRLAQVDHDDVRVLRDDAVLGAVMMHFPRIGYTIRAL